jgi:membrane protease YdiL (CAAX protease family)
MAYLEHAQRGKNAAWRYVGGVFTGVLGGTLIAVLLVFALQMAHTLPPQFAQDIQDAGQPNTFYPANGAMFGLLLLAFVFAARWFHGKRFVDVIGLWNWRQFGQGLALWTAVLVAATAIDFLIAPKGFRLTASGQTLQLAAVALGALAIQTFTEEFVFRGYLTQGLLLATRRTVPTVLISGALFGALHIPNGIPQAVSATLFGVVLALLAIRTGGLAFGYGLHLANNVFGAVVLVSSGDAFRGSPGVLTQNTPGLMWWDVAVGAVALLLVAAWILRTPAAGASDAA